MAAKADAWSRVPGRYLRPIRSIPELIVRSNWLESFFTLVNWEDIDDLRSIVGVRER